MCVCLCGNNLHSCPSQISFVCKYFTLDVTWRLFYAMPDDVVEARDRDRTSCTRIGVCVFVCAFNVERGYFVFFVVYACVSSLLCMENVSRYIAMSFHKVLQQGSILKTASFQIVYLNPIFPNRIDKMIAKVFHHVYKYNFCCNTNINSKRSKITLPRTYIFKTLVFLFFC